MLEQYIIDIYEFRIRMDSDLSKKNAVSTNRLGEAETRQKEKQVMLTIRRKRAETRACSRCRVRRTTPANMRRCSL